MNAHPELAGRLNWLLNHSMQAGVLVLLVLAVQWLFRHRLTNRWRFALWWIVIVRLLLPFSPQSAVSLFNLVRPSVQIENHRPVAPPNNPVSAPVASVLVPDPKPLQMENPPKMVSAAQDLPPPGQSVSGVAAPVSGTLALTKHRLNWGDLLVSGLGGLWFAGVLVLSGVVLWQVTRFYRKLSEATETADANLQKLLDECRHEFGISQRVAIMETGAVQSPALFGLLRLRLLVPHGFGGQFSERELRYIFLHELAHVKRGDLWLNWLVTALQILHWFNPLLWLGFARLRADRELACDELALLRAGDSAGTAYGETVVKLLENLSCPAAIPGLVGILEEKHQMRRRISMIANFRRPGKWSALAVLLIAGVGAAALTDAQTEKSAIGNLQPAILQSQTDPASPNTTRPDLTGTVSVKGGGSMPMPANVFIETASPKTGSSTFCPSCYADCVKHSRADAQGNFKIGSLDPQLTFQILAVAKGYQPKSISKVDPAKGPVKIELQPLADADAAPERSLRGRVVDVKGQPVEGAVVEAVGFETKDGGGLWGSLPGTDPLAVSDENGEFLITSKNPFDLMDVKVSARTFADKSFKKLPVGKANELVMTEGAVITGRVLSGGRPLGGVTVGISGAERQAGAYAGHFEIGTDADGKFVLMNIPPDIDFWIYTSMSSMKKFGAVPIQKIRSGKDGETTDAGDLIAAPAHRLAGRVVLADGAPLPPKVRLLISREGAWDSMQVTLDADGNFDTTGVPDELMNLSARVKGYHVSARNLSVDQMNPYQMIGRVDRDITNLVFMLEKGPDPQPDYSHVDPEYNEIRNRTLRGAEGAVDHSHEWTVSGHVLDVDTKLPLQNFRVTPGQPDQFSGIAWSTLRAVDGSNGNYTVYISKRSAQPTLKVEADGYMPASLDVQPGEASNVDFILQKGRDPQGIVVTPEGKPAAGATLVMFSGGINEVRLDSSGELGAQGNRYNSQIADTDGKFTFKPVFGMKFLLASSSNGFAAVSLESLATNPTVTLEPYGKIAGTLKRTSGPGTNEVLDIRFTGDLANINTTLPARTDEHGQFRFGRVPPGHLKITYREPVNDLGAWHNNPLREVDLKPGQSLEVSIETGDRPPPETNFYQRPPPPKAVPGQQIKGIVFSPDGKPAADAEVALQIPSGPFLFQIGHGAFSNGSGLRENGLLVNAGPDGAFTLPLYEKATSVVAINEDGYAQVLLDDLKASPQIHLQKWGRIEGTLRVGHHLGTNETVDLSAARPYLNRRDLRMAGQITESTNSVPEVLIPPMFDFNAFQARTDGQGKFIITFVPPGKESIYRKIPIGPGSWSQSQLTDVEVKPGETIVTNVGGGGRTVTGKVEFKGDLTVDFTKGMGDITTPTFQLFEKARQLKTDAERQAFYASPEVEAAMDARRSFSLRVKADGTFRAEDVLPGNYEFTFQPTVRLDHNSSVWVMLDTETEFSIPEAKNTEDDSTVELGTIELKKRVMPLPEEAAKTK